MPALKSRKHRKPTVKALPGKKTRGRARVAAKRVVRKGAASPARAEAVPPRPDQTTVTLGPHHVDRHLGPIGFKVHPGPTLHPVGPMAMKHPRATLRHH